MAPSVGISYKAVVWPRPTLGRCPRDGQKVLLKVVKWDHLRDPHGESKGKKGMKTGSMNTGKNNPALEKGHTKRTGSH